jgi:hypothetical protein
VEAYRQIGYIAPLEHVEFAAKIRRGEILPGRAAQTPDDELLNGLRSALVRVGKLSVEIIEHSPELHSPYVYRRRFGGLRRTYALVGYEPNPRQNGGLDSHPGQTISKAAAAQLLDRQRAQWEQTQVDIPSGYHQ